MVKGTISLLIVALIISADSSNELNEDCIVKERFDRNAINGDKFDWIAFLKEDIDLTIHVAHVGRDTISDNDILHVKYNKLHREITRNMTSIRNEELSKNILLRGWIHFSTKIESSVMNMKINSKEFTIKFEYPIRHITILSDQMASCTKGEPTWKITRGENSTIPTVELGTIYFSLSSKNSFSPVIYSNNSYVSLQYNFELEVVIGQYNKKLPLPYGKYDFRLEKAAKRWILSYKQPETGFESILEVKRMDTNINMGVSSLDEDFLLELRLGYGMDENNTYSDPTHILDKNIWEENSCYTMKDVLISVFVVFAIMIGIMAGIIYYFLKNKTETTPNEESDLEKQPLMEYEDIRQKVDIKEIIDKRSQLIESQDQSIHTYKLIVTEDHQDSEKKVRKLSFGLLNSDSDLPTKSILILGEKNTGKSTTINSMINHILGIEFEDKNRFHLIENAEIINKTEFMTAYVFPYKNGMPNNCNYTIIDTPGFGDSEGFEQDKGLMLQLEHFLKQDYNISKIDVFGFVVKSDATKLTQAQRYVFDGLFSMFGNDISHNIFILVTYAGPETPPVLNVLKDAEIQYHDYFKLNNVSMYGETNETDEDFMSPQEINKSNWKMTENSLQHFFKRLASINPVSLSLTKVVLEENARLHSVVIDLQNKIKKRLDNINILSEKKIKSSKPEDTQLIEQEINHTEELLIRSIEEAQKLTERLKDIPLRLNPLSVHGYIELLIENEEKEKSHDYEKRILMLQKLKEENEVLKLVMNDEKSPSTGLLNLFRKSKDV